MGRAYTIGCPGVQWWENGLMLLGFLALIFLASFAYQIVMEKTQFRREVRRRRMAEAEGE